jgi:hypothetical protein
MLLAQPVQKKTIVGVWEVKLSLVDESQSPQLSVAMFGNDGSFTAAGGNKALPPIPALQAVANELGPAFGQWAPSGTREFSRSVEGRLGERIHADPEQSGPVGVGQRVGEARPSGLFRCKLDGRVQHDR